MTPLSYSLTLRWCTAAFLECSSLSLAPGEDTGEDGTATGVQPCPQLHFPFLSAAFGRLQVPKSTGFVRRGWRKEQGLKIRATQLQGTYICQPEVRVSHGHIQHAAGHLLVKDAGISHRLDGLEDDICPLSRVEVFSKGLWQGGRKTFATECPDGAAWLGRAPGSAGSRPHRKAGSSPCVEEGEERALHIGVGAHGWPYRELGPCWGPRELEFLLGLELLPGHQSAAQVLSLLRDGRNLFARAVRHHQPH